MITDLGVPPLDLALLQRVLAGIAPEAWEARVDPESDTTTKLRGEASGWPLVMTAAADVAGAWAFGPGYVNRLVLSRVPAGGAILPHTDDFGEAGRRSHHCHLPLVTDPSVVLGGEGGEAHLAAGRLYRLDASQRHWVRNPSATDRIHLLFAYFPVGEARTERPFLVH